MQAGIWCGNLREEPFGRLTGRWEESIKMDLKEVGWGGMDWINVAEDRDRWRALVTSFQVPTKCRGFLDWPRTS